MQITLNLPEQYLINMGSEEFGRRMKLYTALVMFQSGELSAGAAAELAEVDRFTFLAECRRHGIHGIDYPAGELAAEVEPLD